MRRALSSLVLALVVLPGTVSAQSSQFGIRGLGVPGRGLSARSLSLGGSFGLFDGESSLNPATLSTITTASAMFTSVGSWGSATNPVGASTSRDTRFPLMLVAGPIPGQPFAIGASYSLYTDRDFTVVSNGVAAPRGVNVPVHDTLSSRGGIDDLRAILRRAKVGVVGSGAGMADEVGFRVKDAGLALQAVQYFAASPTRQGTGLDHHQAVSYFAEKVG